MKTSGTTSRIDTENKKKRVDPLTGEPSNADNAITYSTYKARKKVDPLTGQPSSADNAIAYSTYESRKKVDPLTGVPSNMDNAIAYSTYKYRKTEGSLIGEPSTACSEPERQTISTFFTEDRASEIASSSSSFEANLIANNHSSSKGATVLMGIQSKEYLKQDIMRHESSLQALYERVRKLDKDKNYFSLLSSFIKEHIILLQQSRKSILFDENSITTLQEKENDLSELNNKLNEIERNKKLL